MASPATVSTAESKKLFKDQFSLLRRIVSKVYEELSQNMDLRDLSFEQRAFKYTGLQPYMIKLLKETKVMHVEVFEVDRSVVYEQLTDFYICKHEIPTTYELFVALEGNLPINMDIKGFRKMLAKMGFMWKAITNRKQTFFVVIEKPEVVFERYNYLKSINQYRKDQRPIYYVGESYLDAKGNFAMEASDVAEDHKKLFYAVSKDGVEFISYIENFDENYIVQWITEVLMKGIKPNSVIVLSDTKHHNEKLLETPNFLSSDIEIIQWLDHIKVRYTKSVPRRCLYEIAEKKTNLKASIYKIDEILKNEGHVVLRTPVCINKMTPVELVLQTLVVNLQLMQHELSDFGHVEKKFYGIIGAINDDLVVKYCDFIAKEEDDMLKTDVKVDDVYDGVVDFLTLSEREVNDVDSDLPSDTE